MTANVVVTGFMGTGKSAVGRALAEFLDREFIDTDDVIVDRHGSIDEIFAARGEAGFRLLEHDLARELADRSDLVIATGGGMLIDPAVSAILSATGQVFCLVASAETIMARVLADDGPVRPLLTDPDPLARVAELLEARAERYGSFPQVDTHDRHPTEIAASIASLL